MKKTTSYFNDLIDSQVIAAISHKEKKLRKPLKVIAMLLSY